jgi:hypothetical protein
MAGYFAEIDPATQRVVRVVVADSAQWCVDNLGGTWVETVDPHSPTQPVSYCSPGWGYDPAVPERFCGDEWTVGKATQMQPDDDGVLRWYYNTFGQLTFHNGKVWRNLMPTGNPNVWEPPTNWREYPMGDEHPLWVQPVGSVDAYPLSFVVEHDGLVWRSTVEANVWEPPINWEQV